MYLPLLLMCVVSFAACSSRVEHPPPTDQASTALSININTASIEEMDRLPYIGRTTAEAIVAFRVEHGPFRRPEQLMLIRGVSERRFVEIRHLLTAR